MTTEPSYTLRQAAKMTGVSHSTIRRRHAEQEFPNAYKNTEGVWMIPLSDLRQAGIRPRSADRAQESSTVSASVTLNHDQDPAQSPTPPVTAAHDRTPELELAVENWREKAHQAERDLSELRGYVRGIEGTLEESRLRNRELADSNRELTKALLALEPAAPAEPVRLKEGEDYHLGKTPAVHLNADDFPGMSQEQVDTLEDLAREQGRKLKDERPAEPAPKRGWKFWK